MIELDWEDYFRDFCAAHGRPIELEGRLVFPDGWTYSATDYEGPEEPPPIGPNDCRALRLKYWKERYRIIRVELMEAWAEQKYLKQLQAVKSIPLKQAHAIPDDDKPGYFRTQRSRIDFEMLNLQEKRLKKELLLAQQEISKLLGEVSGETSVA